MDAYAAGAAAHRTAQPTRGAHERALRICYVTADYPATSTGGIGGIGAHTSTLAKAVAALGHDVTVLTEADDGPGRFSDGLVTVHAIRRAAPRQWKLGRLVPIPWIRRSFAVWQALSRLHHQQAFDLVSFPDGYGEGLRYSYSPLAPYVIRVSGPASIVQEWDARLVPPVRARAEAWIERRPVARASLLLVATRAFADYLAHRWSLDRERTRIIRNPVDVDRFRPVSPGRRQERPRVLFVGHVQHLKGLATLAAAVAPVATRHPTVEFLIVGNDTRSAPGGTSMRRSIEAVLRDTGAPESVRFVGAMPHSELVAMYQSCSVFVLPSLHEVYGNVVLEAMASGRPCVVTSAVGASELVAEGECGRVVPPENPEALAAALSEVLSLPDELRDEMGARGRRTVERACATSVIAAQTVAAYREVVRGATVQPALGEIRQ